MAKTWTYNKEDGNYSDEEGNIYIIRAGRPIKISSVKKEEKKEEDYKMIICKPCSGIIKRCIK